MLGFKNAAIGRINEVAPSMEYVHALSRDRKDVAIITR